MSHGYHGKILEEINTTRKEQFNTNERFDECQNASKDMQGRHRKLMENAK